MPELLQYLFASDYMPHGHCYQWESDIVWLHAGSDSLIALSYYVIPFLLISFLRRRRDIDFPIMFLMFGAFILLCGTTHLLEVWSIWNGSYRLTGTVKLVTGLTSAATAVMMFIYVPRALTIPSPRQLEDSNAALRAEIDARKRAESALKRSEEQFRGAFYHAAVGKALVAPNGRWLQVNDALCEIAGYGREELLGLRFQDITHPGDLDEDLEQVQRMLSGEIASYQLEKRYVRRDGRAVWVLLSVSAGRLDDGKVEYFIVEVKDVDERRQWQEEQQRLLEEVQAERDKLRAAEQDVARANASLRERNEDLQEFAFVASHDLQEPLRKIIAFSDLLREDCRGQLDARGEDYVDRIENASIRMSQLLNDLLQYARVTTYKDQIRMVDLNQAVRGAIADLEMVIAEVGAEVTATELPVIRAVPLQMHQLFNNLIANAVKYIRDDGTPRVDVYVHAEDADWITVVVEDNGIGFDRKYAERIFAPFERLDSQRRGGTGMGLAICKRIVERHGGSVRAEGRLGEGTRIILRLPKAASDC